MLGLRWLTLDTTRGTPAAAAAAGNLLTFVICAYWALPVINPLPLDWLLIAYLGVFQIALAYVLVTAAMHRVTALEASLLILIEPVLNPVWAWLFLGETPGHLALVAGGIIIASIILQTVQQRRIVLSG